MEVSIESDKACGVYRLRCGEAWALADVRSWDEDLDADGRRGWPRRRCPSLGPNHRLPLALSEVRMEAMQTREAWHAIRLRLEEHFGSPNRLLGEPPAYNLDHLLMSLRGLAETERWLNAGAPADRLPRALWDVVPIRPALVAHRSVVIAVLPRGSVRLGDDLSARLPVRDRRIFLRQWWTVHPDCGEELRAQLQPLLGSLSPARVREGITLAHEHGVAVPLQGAMIADGLTVYLTADFQADLREVLRLHRDLHWREDEA